MLRCPWRQHAVSMTSHHLQPAESGSAQRGSSSRRARPHVRLTHPSELLSALPALLGYYPEESVVVICMGGPRNTDMKGFVRADIPLETGGTPDWESVERMLASFREFCYRNEVETVLITVVSTVAPLVKAEFASWICAGLEEAGISVGAAYMTARIEAGERWFSHFPVEDAGWLTDPRDSEVAAELVVAGRVIQRSRADMIAELDTADGARMRRIDQMISVPGEGARRVRSDTDSDRLHTLLSAIAAMASGACFDDAEYAKFGEALLRVPVRDCLFTLALTDSANEAEHFWLDLTRTLPPPARAEAAVLLGYSAYVRGEGTRAGAAFDIALETEPDHKMANMLLSALCVGFPPQHVAEIATIGWELAADIGVVLPPLAEADLDPGPRG